MRGNNCQQRAMDEQESQYRLSEDVASVVPAREPTVGWPPTLWTVLTVKYLHDSRRRSTLGALGVMAGYEVISSNVR
jgi:hypothetical protein